MNKELIKEFNNVELLKEICKAYNYSASITDNQVVCIIDGGDENDYDTYKYNTVEEALIDWLDTLIESEMQYIEENANITWLQEIEYIKELRTNLLFDDNDTTLNDLLTYGDIPTNLYKNLSVFAKRQSILTNRYIRRAKALKRPGSYKAIENITLPVEFVLVDDKLEYVKIANKDFLKRLIFDLDSSEVDYLEQDVYSKKGLVDFMPLLPMDKVKKFEINVPVSIIVLPNNDIEIKRPVKYLELF